MEVEGYLGREVEITSEIRRRGLFGRELKQQIRTTDFSSWAVHNYSLVKKINGKYKIKVS